MPLLLHAHSSRPQLPGAGSVVLTCCCCVVVLLLCCLAVVVGVFRRYFVAVASIGVVGASLVVTTLVDDATTI